MPIVKSISLGTCPADGVGGSLTGRVVTSIVDNVGNGTLEYSVNSGVLPDDLDNDFEVYVNGNRLEYPAEYTVTEFGGGISTSIIQIASMVSDFLTPPAHYVVIAYYPTT